MTSQEFEFQLEIDLYLIQGDQNVLLVLLDENHKTKPT